MSTYFLSRGGLAFRCEVRYPHSHWAGEGRNEPDGVLSDSNSDKYMSLLLTLSFYKTSTMTREHVPSPAPKRSALPPKEGLHSIQECAVELYWSTPGAVLVDTATSGGRLADQ